MVHKGPLKAKPHPGRAAGRLLARAIAEAVSVGAKRLLRKQWTTLRRDLVAELSSYLDSAEPRPSLLAQRFLISAEDHRFFSHRGIDPVAICRAMWRGVVLRRREGASTIEMQVIRVVSGRFERTLRRKIHELALATLVSSVIPKEALPGLYLRIGYYGWRMNGFSGACRRLQLDPRALGPIEAAGLVARLKYPQPRLTDQRRWSQIHARAQHILRLYADHRYDGTYGGVVIGPLHETF